MKLIKYLKKIVLASVPLLAICSCSNGEREVTPCEVDIDEIYKVLSPNEEDNAQGLTFGKDSIPGSIIDFDMQTESQEIYVFFENLTVLDINPKITKDLFEFATEELKEYGFISEDWKLTDEEFNEAFGEPANYYSGTMAILEKIKGAFDTQYSEIKESGEAFNAYFLIYPVYLNDNYVTYRESAYCYTGGAHGMTISYLHTYDLKSGERLTVDDIVTPEGMKSVREEVVAHMAYCYPIYENIKTVNQYIDSLNVWLDNFDQPDDSKEITVENFPLSDPGLTSEGLVFVYEMYQLTPGSDGCPVVLIPYKDIKGCLYDKLGV